ncbi:hypothetical protein PAXRUDRAFT_448543 [Paxillus rubicundulus Ve08.2h10]|uniref:Uncharacterized protein n=1 Tax=Paxillus rubicundulus Ve08.2h10 TaxID=930991 RepID=A0A0D0DBB0_9AGAM|nr:hypothetical protein PAXRUDRAFT_448543 [Paxillus rubicundulus Ve08.2h10]
MGDGGILWSFCRLGHCRHTSTLTTRMSIPDPSFLSAKAGVDSQANTNSYHLRLHTGNCTPNRSIIDLRGWEMHDSPLQVCRLSTPRKARQGSRGGTQSYTHYTALIVYKERMKDGLR